MKKMKKIMILLVIFSFLANIVPVNAATVDKNPPTLKSISIKNPKSSYNVGEKVYLNLNVTDDVSGVASIVLMFSDINDGYRGIETEVYDIEGKPYFEVPRLSGKENVISLRQINLSDNSGNPIGYLNDKNVDDFYRYLDFDVEFKAIYNGSDITGPELIDINLDKTKVKYGEKINITLKATDDMSGVKSAEIGFGSSEANTEMFYKTLQYDSKTRWFKGSISAPPFNGKYEILDVRLIDNEENESRYSDVVEFDYKLLEKVVSFTVTGAPDSYNKEWKISNIDFKYKKLVAPSVYEIGLKLNENIDYINQVNISIGLKSEEGSNYTVFLFKDDDGYFRGHIDVNQFFNVGVYELKHAWVILNDDKDDYVDEEIKMKKTELFEVVEDTTYDVVTSTTDKEIISKITEAKDNAKIAISSFNDSVIKKEVFESIKGTNKTIYIESNGIQWVFNGKDIVNPKDIDVSVEINYLYNDELADEIKEILGNSIVINFNKNGKLPGKTLVRVKTDYALRDYLGIENLQVYYYNGAEVQMFDSVANNISMTEDGYLEFYIDHNSSFVISNEKVNDKYVSNNLEDLSLNDETIVIEETDEDNNNNNNALLYNIIGISLIAVATIIIVIIKKKRKNKKKEINLEVEEKSTEE